MTKEDDHSPFIPFRAFHVKKGNRLQTEMNLIGEEPLSIRLEGKPYVVIMRTPGDEIVHAAGFCLSEGIIENRSHLASIAFCEREDNNVVDVTLIPGRKDSVKNIPDGSFFVSQTSCGICGREMVSDYCEAVSPVSAGATIPFKKALELIENLKDHQELRKKTRAAHGAAVVDRDFSVISFGEDVGRHNAMDKALGKLLMQNRLSEAAAVVLSSRVSYELVNKAARAAVPFILSVSRPTSLAVRLAKRLNIATASLARPEGLYIYTGTKHFT